MRSLVVVALGVICLQLCAAGVDADLCHVVVNKGKPFSSIISKTVDACAFKATGSYFAAADGHGKGHTIRFNMFDDMVNSKYNCSVAETDFSEGCIGGDSHKAFEWLSTKEEGREVLVGVWRDDHTELKARIFCNEVTDLEPTLDQYLGNQYRVNFEGPAGCANRIETSLTATGITLLVFVVMFAVMCFVIIPLGAVFCGTTVMFGGGAVMVAKHRRRYGHQRQDELAGTTQEQMEVPLLSHGHEGLETVDEVGAEHHASSENAGQGTSRQGATEV